jgi:NADPH-dependent curcumin reductase CurA
MATMLTRCSVNLKLVPTGLTTEALILFTVGAALVMPGLTAWQGLFEHSRLQAGQSVLVHGAAVEAQSLARQTLYNEIWEYLRPTSSRR